MLASDLDQLSTFLKSKFNYDTGPYQGYEFSVPARRLLAKADWNVSSHNKLSVRYNQLDSSTDLLVSELELARLRQPPDAHRRAQFQQLELQDPGEHPLRDWRAEYGHRQHDVEQR